MPVLALIGASGQLGGAVLETFAEAGWTTISLARREVEAADHADVLAPDALAEVDHLAEHLRSVASEVDAVVSVAGAWRGGDIRAEDLAGDLEVMWQANALTATLAGRLAARVLRPGGMLVLTGAAAALVPSPEMIAYGMAKAAVHHLVASLAADPHMPAGAVVLGLQPSTLDTPANREAMPTADWDQWTPLKAVGRTLLAWAEGDARPESGTIIPL